MWRIEKTVASLALNKLTAMVRLDRPGGGLFAARHQNESLSDCELLGARFGVKDHDDAEGELLDSYVRGSDLVASYGTCDHLISRIYWRAIQHFAAPWFVGVELIVSTQTDLLDINPRLFLGSRVRCDEVLCLGNADSGFASLDLQGETKTSDVGVFIFRLPRGRASYVEMVDPKNMLDATIHINPSEPTMVTSEYRVLDEPMEKGVIRQNRMRGLWLDRANDEASALESYQAFVESTIPLNA